MSILLILILAIQFQGGSTDNNLESLLTPQEQKWIAEHKDGIRFAPNPSWPPVDYVEGGIHQGIVSEYIAIFESKLGFSFPEVKFSSWKEVPDGLKQAEADFVGGIQKTVERDEFLAYTNPYLEIPVVLLVRNDYSGIVTDGRINEMTLAGVGGYASLDYIQKEYPDANIIEYDDDLAALMQTSLGNTDGTVIDLMTASYLVEKYGINNLALGNKLDYTWEIRFASRKDMPILHSVLNKLLASIDESKRKEIYSRWVNINNIESRNAFERNYQRLIYITGFILLIVISVTYYNHDLKKQVKSSTSDLQKELTEKAKAQEELQHRLKEREVLLAEIHHRVKNNLAIICSLLQLELMEVEDGDAMEVLSNSVMRIKSMALIHEKLYETNNLKSIPFQWYLDDLLDNLELKYNPESRIQINKHMDVVHMNINLAIPAALLVNELVTNAFKHAFPNGQEGKIVLELKKNEAEITLTVMDNGVGLPPDFDLNNRTSVGSMLIHVLTKQLNAECSLDREGGTRYTFRFKNYDKKGASANIFPAMA